MLSESQSRTLRVLPDTSCVGGSQKPLGGAPLVPSIESIAEDSAPAARSGIGGVPNASMVLEERSGTSFGVRFQALELNAELFKCVRHSAVPPT